MLDICAFNLGDYILLASGENHQKVSVKNSQLKSKGNHHNIRTFEHMCG